MRFFWIALSCLGLFSCIGLKTFFDGSQVEIFFNEEAVKTKVSHEDLPNITTVPFLILNGEEIKD